MTIPRQDLQVFCLPCMTSPENAVESLKYRNPVQYQELDVSEETEYPVTWYSKDTWISNKVGWNNKHCEQQEITEQEPTARRTLQDKDTLRMYMKEHECMHEWSALCYTECYTKDKRNKKPEEIQCVIPPSQGFFRILLRTTSTSLKNQHNNGRTWL